jgi:hypothetical protein
MLGTMRHCPIQNLEPRLLPSAHLGWMMPPGRNTVPNSVGIVIATKDDKSLSQKVVSRISLGRGWDRWRGDTRRTHTTNSSAEATHMCPWEPLHTSSVLTSNQATNDDCTSTTSNLHHISAGPW